MADFPLTLAELRGVTAYAVACAEPALPLFTRARPRDPRPRAAVEAARAFAQGAPRSQALRDAAWAAHRAARETRADALVQPGAGSPAARTSPDAALVAGSAAALVAASEAARAALAAAGAAYLHPLARATQVLHILGAAAHAARAFELDTGDPAAALTWVETARTLATPTVISVLTRYPPPPPGRGRPGELVRLLDTALRP